MEEMIIGIGEVLWDMLPEGKKAGGAPANFAYNVAQFGLKSAVVSAIGDDELGCELIATFNQKSLGFRIATVGYPTGTVEVRLDSKGVPVYDIRRDVAWDHIPLDDTLREIASRTKAVCFGSLAQRSPESRTTITRFVEGMGNDEDRLKIFDINLRQNFYTREVVETSLDLCNILKINDEELGIVSKMFNLGEGSQEQSCRELLNRYGLRILILTCGVNGSYVLTPESTSYLPTPKVKVVDTVGAGDAFTGSFIASILKGRTIAEAHARAVEVSAFVCTREGAMPALPSELTC